MRSPSQIEFVKESIYRESCPCGPWQISRYVNLDKALAFSGDRALWRTMGMSWGESPGTYWFRTRIVIPQAMDGERVELRLANCSEYPRFFGPIPWGVGLTGHFEALVYVNGEAAFGLDPNHSEFILVERAAAGETYELLVEAYTTSPKSKYWHSRLAVRDRALWDVYHDLLSLLELINGFESAGGAGNAADDSGRNDRDVIHGIAAVYDRALRRLHSLGDAWVTQAVDIGAEIREGLSQVHGPLGSEEVLLVGHSHIDTAWLWRIAETRRKIGRTFSTNLKFLDTFQEFTYIQSAPINYEYCREDYPELYARIRKQVAAGTWDPNGAMYVEADCNMSSGEALARQLIYGKTFFREELGVDSRVLWLPDVFGFTGNLPQLMKLTGVELFVNMKLETLKGEGNPLQNYWWEGIDGSRVMAHHQHGYVNWALASRFISWTNANRRKRGPSPNIMPFGFGDGGGGAREEDIELAKRWRNLPFFPKVSFTTGNAFADCLKPVFEKGSDDIPVHYGELYLEAHRGTYTSVAQVKRWNRECENALLRAETWAAAAKMLKHRPYPRARLRRAWKDALLNQFHDILPGSSIPEVYVDAAKSAESCLTATAEVASDSLAALTGDSEGGCLVVNSLSHEVSGLVRLSDDVPCGDAQRIDLPDGGSLRAAWTRPVGPWSVSRIQTLEHLKDPFDWRRPELGTPYWRARFHPDRPGEIVSLYDRSEDRWVNSGHLNQLQGFNDKPPVCEPWEMTADMFESPADIFSHATQEVIADGPLIFIVRATYEGASSKLVQDIRFYAHSPRIDFVTWVDWHERRKILKVAFPLRIASDVSWAETAYGHQSNPMTRDTLAEEARFETPMHRWVALTDGDYGVALLNDSKYGYDGLRDTLRLTLLKSAGHAQIDPDYDSLNPLKTVERPAAWADQGKHEFSYSLWPFKGDVATGGVLREARLLNSPLHAINGNAEVAPLIHINNPNIIAETLKEAEDGAGVVLRLYEASGSDSSATLRLTMDFGAWQECDLLEHPLHAQGGPGDITLDFHRFEIKTIRFT